MYLVGDKVNIPSSTGLAVTGKIELVEEQTDGSIGYVINTDEGIVIRNSNDDADMSLVNHPELDFS